MEDLCLTATSQLCPEAGASLVCNDSQSGCGSWQLATDRPIDHTTSRSN